MLFLVLLIKKLFYPYTSPSIGHDITGILLTLIHCIRFPDSKLIKDPDPADLFMILLHPQKRADDSGC